MPLFAGVGVLGGLLRDLAPEPEEIWRFSPFFDLSSIAMLRNGSRRTRLFHSGIPVDHPVRRMSCAGSCM